MTIATKLLLCFASGLPVEAQTLDGDGVSGELVSLTATEAGVLVDGESRILRINRQFPAHYRQAVEEYLKKLAERTAPQR